jgi:hypothetical protein
VKRIDTKAQLDLMCELGLRPEKGREAIAGLSQWDERRLISFFDLLRKHHMILRALNPLQQAATDARLYHVQEAAQAAISAERQRIRASLECLRAICDEFESGGCPVVLFKTLDHWPDFGTDLDLCTIGDERWILDLIVKKFHARRVVRSLGDHLAHKWSFNLGGGPTEVEIHINRLGQAGEHVELARRFINRRRYIELDGYPIPVPAPEERVIAAALQRMYRHLYFRVCDIVNLSALIQSRELCYSELKSIAEECGIWPGVAACLKIVSDYVKPYVDDPLDLPPEVNAAAEDINLTRLFIRDGFFHVPLVPYGARLFLRQFAHALRSGDVAVTARLSLLPPLASVAGVAYAVTGSSGRVW